MTRLLGRILRLSIQQLTAYRANLVFEGFLTLVRLAAGLVALGAVFSQTDSLAGWSLGGTVVLLGTYQVVGGLMGAFIQPNLSFFSEQVREGKLDDILLKPVPSIFMASLGSCSPWPLLQVVLGAGVVALGVASGGLTTSSLQVACYLLQLGSGVVVAWAYLVVLASASFWAAGLELNVLYSASWQLGRYPVDVYHPAITCFLTFVVPIAFVSTYPARTLAASGGGPAGVGASLLAAAISLVVANLVWQAGTRRYTSATS